jgi:TolB-like protein/predicted Ser/Thr protein kinase
LNSGQDLQPGSSLLHYKILSRLGEGGMGVVYRAEDTRLGRIVALKILRSDLAHDEEWNMRFQREVRAVSAVSHPGVATLYDVHKSDETIFYTMEFVEGRNLREALAGGPLPVPQLLKASLQLAEALAEAHKKGIVHRDLKPENVMEANSGYYKILDFGLARMIPEGMEDLGNASRMETMAQNNTQVGKLVGTVSYMSPEQAQGRQEIDTRSDIFGFGSLLYELAVGKAPFARNNAISTFHAIVHEDPEPVTRLRPELPEELGWITARCLAKDPGQRYQSTYDLAEDLRALAVGGESGARRAVRIRPFPPKAGSWKPVTLVAAGVAVVAVAALVIILNLTYPDPAPEQAGSRTVPSPVAQASNAVDRNTVAVSSFADNTGDEARSWMSDGVPEMLTTELVQSGELKVISTQRMKALLSMAGKDSGVHQGGGAITQAARWAGAGIVISGAIFKSGDGHRIDAQAYDTTTGEILAASKVEGADLFEMVDQISDELMGGLEIETRPEEGLQAMTTASPEAFRHYTEGVQRYKDLNFEEANRNFEESLKADPKFSLAKMRLGMSLYLSGDKDEGIVTLVEASENPGNLPARDLQLMNVLNAHFALEDSERATEAVIAFHEAFPNDQEVNFWVAQARADVEGDSVGAIRVLQKVIRAEPGNLPAVSVLSTQLAQIGQPADAERILQSYRERHPAAAAPLTELIEICREPGEPEPDSEVVD